MTVSEVLRSRWTWGGAAALALIGAFGAGRYMAPTKVEERTREVVVYKTDEKAVAKAVSDARTTWEREVKDNTRIVTKYVEGKVVERVEYRDRDTTSSGGKVEIQTVTVEVEKRVEVEKVVEKERIVTRDAPRWTVGATVGTGFQGGSVSPPAWGGLVGYRLVGPLGVQIAGEGNALGGSVRAGVTLGF
jgi:asparagine N-glycosylation enzyme membrane subunit Stt3